MHKVCEGDSASRLVWVLSHDSYGLSCPIVHDHGVNETWSTYDERMCYALVKAWAFERLRAQHVVLIYIHTYTDPVGQSWPRGQLWPTGSVGAGHRVSRPRGTGSVGPGAQDQ